MLSDIDLKAMTARSSSYKRSDSGGLFILVRPDGQKFWRLAYRYDGKQKLLSGGAYPVVGLHAARVWRDAVRTQLARTRPTHSRMPSPPGYRYAVQHGRPDTLP